MKNRRTGKKATFRDIQRPHPETYCARGGQTSGGDPIIMATSREKQTMAIIIEDELPFGRVLNQWVAGLGFATLVGATIHDGRRLLESSAKGGRSVAAVLIDLRLPDGDGRTLIPLARTLLPDARIIVVSAYLDGSSAIELQEQGVTLLPKLNLSKDAIARAVQHETHRKALYNSLLASARRFGISNRELEVLSLLVQGQSSKEIAAELGISTRTVEGHIRAIRRATGCHSRAEVVALVLGIDGR